MFNTNKKTLDKISKKYESLTETEKVEALNYQKNMKEKVQKQYDDTLDAVNTMKENKDTTNFNTSQVIQSKMPKRRLPTNPQNYINIQATGQPQQFQHYLPQINTNGILGNIPELMPKERKEFEDAMKKFGDDAFKSALFSVPNKNIFDWKHIDVYQMNIGSVKSIVEFFFNMMMVYNNSVITRNGIPKEKPTKQEIGRAHV